MAGTKATGSSCLQKGVRGKTVWPNSTCLCYANLYLETSDPVLLFNQGCCFEQSSRYEEAIARFREYLCKATDASAADKADAEKHIA